MAKIASWNRIGTKYGTLSAMSHSMVIYKAEIDFSSPAASCSIVCVGNVLTNRGIFPHTKHMTTTIRKSSIPSYGVGASENQFHSRIDFSKENRFNYVESMPGVLKSFEMWTVLRGYRGSGGSLFSRFQVKSTHSK